MLRRHLDSDFVGGAYVFPGGKVDETDRSVDAQEVCSGRTDAEASTILDVESGGLAFWVAALRECFEEAGVLLAYRDEEGAAATVDVADPVVRRRLAKLRGELNSSDVDFIEACRAEGLSLAVDRVHYFSHWVTPEPAPKRYDTRFFVAALPAGQVAVHDDYETVDTVWVRPAEALDRARAGEFDLIFPTMKNLQAIGRFATSAELLSAAAAVERVPTIVPRVISDDRGFRILLPGDPGYDEAVSSEHAAGTVAGAVSHAGGPLGSEDPGPGQVGMAEMGDIIRSIGIDGRSDRRPD